MDGTWHGQQERGRRRQGRQVVRFSPSSAGADASNVNVYSPPPHHPMAEPTTNIASRIKRTGVGGSLLLCVEEILRPLLRRKKGSPRHDQLSARAVPNHQIQQGETMTFGCSRVSLTHQI